jgi:hypothetical protein
MRGFQRCFLLTRTLPSGSGNSLQRISETRIHGGPTTRRRAGFLIGCEGRGLFDLARIKPLHIAACIEDLQRTHSKPTVKQHLAALRMLFDSLVVGHIVEVNPAHAVRGPKHVVKKGKTPVLTADETRILLDSIATARWWVCATVYS